MVSALIVAAGKGTRMGTNVDKVFLPVAGRPVLAHTWGLFERSSCIDEIILVVREGMEATVEELGRSFGYRKSCKIVLGGKERQDSVSNGLNALHHASDIVAIQDAARPCTSDRLIQDTVDAAREFGAAVAAQPVTDTIKQSDDGKLISRTLDRSTLWAVQTPQVFRVSIIRRAIAEVQSRGLSLTDDTAACEMIGQAVRLVISTEPNPKVTRPNDLGYIETLLASSKEVATTKRVS